ncbi:hypothetical protein QMK33_10070 [Hymenobacter sp. H14-R3]|uniref:hypothetical protein n=1 Tax=Hymenobacter sp. H14-R3 TaxID=3046308 RepID=UPI0024BA780E|nr:hypothetical protein [Hymenobacter sp. H14-R3]MDJ0365500.1 hypothetical protein [Hymenobacter sp. H14-R3]
MNARFSILATGLLTAASATVGWAQHHPGVYTSSQEYVHNQPAHPGTVGALAASLAYLEVVNAHTHAVHRVPLTSVWGYADAKGQGFRLVERKAYAVHHQQDNLVTYSRQRAIQHSRSKHIVTEHFYSQTLDGKLLPLTKRALKQQQAAR